MTHDQHRHSHHSDHGHGGMHSAPRRMSSKHAWKLLVLNVVLYGICSAFAGYIMMDYLPTQIEMKVLLALVVVPLVVAIVSTVVHMKARTWTDVDDIAERFSK